MSKYNNFTFFFFTLKYKLLLPHPTLAKKNYPILFQAKFWCTAYQWISQFCYDLFKVYLKFVVLVQGLREASDLGVTLTHEHLTIQIPSFYTPPKEKLAEKLKDVAFEMQYLGWIRQNP